MIRTYNKQTVVVEQGVAKYLADIFCNSADTKPTDGLVNGSKLTEVDTGKTYLFDEANTEWVEYAEGGGGGGSSDLTVFTVSSIPDLGDPPAIVSTGAFADYYGKTLIVFNDPPGMYANMGFHDAPQSYGFATTDAVKAVMQNPNLYFTVVDSGGVETDTRYEGRLIIVDSDTVMSNPDGQRMVGEGADGECICVIIHNPLT